ncbi:hypothetical protein JR316_0004098 [Psilocybe cubensis]|uniref:Macrofage activating glycoprotein n=2 Tax=Psilocybe cubensis TaxID=181762 RepID=A0A8H7Y6I1_PSICU|nr:hypothetical protein JR316_0004098 [Psilocybe cubensis]KAH9484616.1 hypothetical protein JR316_0004098 [Psilocybe cubensis]
MFSSSLLFAVALAGVHSFSFVAAAEDPVITPKPTPTLAKRQQAGAPGTPILSTLSFAFTDLPEQVYPFPVLRGPQSGFNICNSTTLGPNSLCQTLVFNDPTDFCLWGSPDTAGEIGNVEARVVAYCTKPYHGTRLIPPDAITGLQWVKTSAYIQVTGFIKNSGLGLDDNPGNGGELDPHGADLQGNPLGGVVFSNGTADSDGHTLTQVLNWNNFVGNGQFCFKACFNSVKSPDYCENRYDLVGCQYNMPSNVKDGEFTECDSDLQDVVGTYTGADGKTSVWSMPDPLTTTPPYTPRVPASRNCKTFAATDLFLPVTQSSSSGAAGTTPTGQSGSGSGSGAPGATNKASSGSGSSSGAPPKNSSPAARGVSVGVPSALFAMVLAAAGGAAMVL